MRVLFSFWYVFECVSALKAANVDARAAEDVDSKVFTCCYTEGEAHVESKKITRSGISDAEKSRLQSEHEDRYMCRGKVEEKFPEENFRVNR